MAEPTVLAFTFKEIAEALVRQHGLHEGIWGIHVEFGIGGANLGAGPGVDVKPAALVPIVSFGLRRYEEVTSLSVDAALVNPAPKGAPAPKAPRRK